MGRFSDAKKAAENKMNSRSSRKDGKNARGKRGKKNFFADLKAEFKRVIWPDMKSFKQNFVVVLTIVVISAFLIFAVDGIVNRSLEWTGFYEQKTEEKETAKGSENESKSQGTGESRNSDSASESAKDASQQ